MLEDFPSAKFLIMSLPLFDVMWRLELEATAVSLYEETKQTRNLIVDVRLQLFGIVLL